MTKDDSPEMILKKGCSILDPLLQKYGFTFEYYGGGKGSGGQFAHGAYRKHDRKLELHYRYSLGLVTYHIGEYHLEHLLYMRFLGFYDQALYPGFSADPLDVFRYLKQDLEKFCSDFLNGDGKQFQIFSQENLDNPNKFKGFM